MKLSVVIPVYNVSPWLPACLDSVAAAVRAVGPGEAEVLLADDGSTDGGGRLLDAFSATAGFPVRVLHLPHRGVGAARNAALDAASGEWLGFVDADDAVAADWFVRLLSLATDGVDLVHADAAFCFGRALAGGGEGEVRAVANPVRLFLRDGWSFLNLVRRSVVGSLRYREDVRLKEDVIFFSALAHRAHPRVVSANLRGYDYRERAGSAIAQHVGDGDCRRFYEGIADIGLPREEAGRAIGFDLVLWVKGRDRSRGYDAASCPILAFWRRGVADGLLVPSRDLRAWWRPGLRHWLATGDLSWLEATCRLRIAAERIFSKLKW